MLHITADGLNNREGRFDDVGAPQGAPKLVGYAQLMNCKRLFEPFLQAASRARIEMQEFAMQSFQRLLSVCVISHGISALQLSSDRRFMLFRQVIHNVPFLMDLTAL